MAQDSPEPAVTPPAPYRHRPPTMADLQEATDFFNICEVDESGVPDFELEEVEEEWAEIDISKDLLLVETPEGQIVGSMTVNPRGGGVFEASGYTHPEHRGNGIGSHIVVWSEHRALQDGGGIDAPEAALVRNWVLTQNSASGQLLQNRGYQQVKRFMRMEIELASDPEPAQIPAGIELQDLDVERDISGVYSVIDESFAEHWSGSPRTFDEWKKTALGVGFEPTLWTQAFRDGERVGVAMGRNLAGYGWIQWVGVLKPERGKGLGSALLRHQFAQFWRLGVHTIGLGVDSENTTGAQDLYLKAGMQLSRSYDAYEKRLGSAAGSAR